MASSAIISNGNIYVCGNINKGDSTRFTLLPSNVFFDTVSLGSHHLAAIDVNGNLWTQGKNIRGCLGLGNIQEANELMQVTTGINFVCVYLCLHL